MKRLSCITPMCRMPSYAAIARGPGWIPLPHSLLNAKTECWAVKKSPLEHVPYASLVCFLGLEHREMVETFSAIEKNDTLPTSTGRAHCR